MHCELLYTLSNIENDEDFLINMFLREFSYSSQSAQGMGLHTMTPLYIRVGQYLNQAEWTYAIGFVICGDLKTVKKIQFEF